MVGERGEGDLGARADAGVAPLADVRELRLAIVDPWIHLCSESFPDLLLVKEKQSQMPIDPFSLGLPSLEHTRP